MLSGAYGDAGLGLVVFVDGVNTDLRLTIWDRRIVYDDHGRHYRPGGIELPARCPRSGFRFRAQLGFDDGSKAVQDARAALPRAPVNHIVERSRAPDGK